jgi:GDP-L-fucose synthase
MLNLPRRIYVAGHGGMVGSAFIRKLSKSDNYQIITAPRSELDLIDQRSVHCFLKDKQPDLIIVAAAKVGGILANNTQRAEFIYENLMIEANLIHGAHLANINRLLFLGSSCIYPRECLQPIREEYLLTGLLETTNEPYALAKIAGIKLCEAYSKQYGRKYFSVMPTNLYGPNDNYDISTSHVLPAFIRKVHEAKINNINEIVIWGSGKPKREFLYVDDLVDACLHLLSIDYHDAIVNVGTGVELTILELANLIMEVIGYEGNIVYDQSKPDGTPRKLLDVSRLINLGWKAQTTLRNGLSLTYDDFKKNVKF